MSSALNPESGTSDRGRTRGGGSVVGPGHQELVARQKDLFGGMKFGCSFFGWLTATGTAVLLSALLAAVGGVLGYYDGALGPQPADNQNLRTLGLISGIVLLVVVLVSYIAGGYVAARMARFSGLKQGFGVWLWAIIITIVLVVIGLVAGGSLNLPTQANGLPQLPVDQGTLTSGGIITLVAVALIALVGALLGGLAGMRYHRRVDRAGFEQL